MQHIIKKQVIEVKLIAKQNAFRIQHLISEHYRNEIVNLLEEIFDKYCGENEVLLIDKLEINFGIITEADLEKTRWDETILARFKANLLENLSSLSATKTFTKQSKSINICRQWLFYIQHGYVSWNTLQINEQWYNNVLEILATDYTNVTALRELILQNKKAAYRIALQHDAIFLTKLIEILTAQNQKTLADAIEEISTVANLIKQPTDQMSPAVTFSKMLWQEAVAMAAAGQQSLSTETIVNRLFESHINELPSQKRKQQQLISAVSIIRESLISLFQKQSILNKKERLLRKEVKENKRTNDNDADQPDEHQIVKDSANAGIENEKSSEKNTDKKTIVKDTDKNVDAEKKEDVKKSDKRKKEKAQSDKNEAGQLNDETLDQDIKAKETHHEPAQLLSENKTGIETASFKKNNEEAIPGIQLLNEVIGEEGIFIQCAGIVLVHPFLGSLFKRLQWTKDNRFVNAEAQLKAVFMLHFLATGETVADEYQLVLCKLMCAYPIKETLPDKMIFTEEEVNEANDMLTATIQQWSKLQNTSVAGLREGFLQRGGKLFIKNEMPHLQVESHAIDVLLDYLPWNLSIIKLPWMKEIVRVEWR